MLPDTNDPRFSELEDGQFKFACHPEVSCFNQCCRKLNLVLTPYDILRLKNRLKMTCKEFVERHGVVETGQNGWTQVRLAMNQDEEHECPFLSPQGCTVYEDRPGACRTYPLGRAARGGKETGLQEESFFLVKEEHCRGFEDGPSWTPQSWIKDQGLGPYLEMNDLFLPIITRQASDSDAETIAKKMRMFALACYNLESFRDFVLKTNLAKMFEVSPQRLAKLAQDDEELLKFAFDWLRFSIFGDATMKLRPEVVQTGMA